MSELKPLPCPICGDELKIHGPEDWHPTPYDPDSGGDPYSAFCDCGFQYSNGSYDYSEFVLCLNHRAQPANEPLTHCRDCTKAEPFRGNYICSEYGGIWGENDGCTHGERQPERSENDG